MTIGSIGDRTRVDPNNLDKFMDLAIDFVDSQPDDTWTNAFFIMSDIYELTVCTCLLPTIICRLMIDEPHNVATSRQTGETMEIFKTKMGVQKYVILIALRRKDEQRVAVTNQESSAAAAAAPSGGQIVSAAAYRAPEAEVQQKPAMISRAVSSTPSRSSNSPQAYDEYDNDNNSEGIQDRGERRPPVRPLRHSFLTLITYLRSTAFRVQPQRQWPR